MTYLLYGNKYAFHSQQEWEYKKERDFLCPERKLEKVSLMRLSNTNDYRRRPKALIIAR